MRLLFGILILLSASPLNADPTVASIFGDHMVLQRDQRVAVWGKGSPGERITISLSAASASTTTDPHVTWKLCLPPMQAGPFTVTVRENKIVALKDVMIGEVWLLSGQSNMTFPLERASNTVSAIAAANRPDIRLFTVAKNDSLKPQSQLTRRWQECTPDSARDFSAGAYFFGVELSHNLGVPIGLIHSSWPGSTGEEWVDVDRYPGRQGTEA